MENQQYIQEYEIDIREYTNVIIKRKKLILSIFLAAVIITALVSLRLPKIYEITSIIQLGSVKELLIKNEEAKAIILNQNSLASIIKDLNLKIPVESLKKDIKISDISSTNLLKIKITYTDIDTALKINDAIVNPLIAQGQKVYQEHLIIINERLKELDLEIRTAYRSNLTMLREKRSELKTLLSNAKDFMVFDAPIKPKYPVGPKKKQNVLTAGMLSLMFGVFLAFILEFWQKSKK